MATEFNPGGAANLNEAVLARLRANPNVNLLSDAEFLRLLTQAEADRLKALRFVTGRLTSAYVLTDTTSMQKAFNISANGAVTLEEGLWDFTCHLHVTGMSNTSGNLRFELTAGTATLGAVSMQASGIDNNNPTGNGAQTGSYSDTLSTNASLLSNAAGTGLAARVEGLFRVTVPGTIIPSIQLVTGGVTPSMQPGSFFSAMRIGDSTSNTLGAWS